MSRASSGPDRVDPRRPPAARRTERHPWWVYRRLTFHLRPLPRFLIIGAKRCGTTSTYSYLVQHPRIMAAWRKEVHFFDNARKYPRGEPWYRAHFPRARPGLISGEATPEYMFRPDATARMARHVPGARLIALLRNPVDRTVSQYHFRVRRGVERRGLEEALEAQPRELSGRALGGASYLVRGTPSRSRTSCGSSRESSSSCWRARTCSPGRPRP